MASRIARLNQYIAGWCAYFGIADGRKRFEANRRVATPTVARRALDAVETGPYPIRELLARGPAVRPRLRHRRHEPRHLADRRDRAQQRPAQPLLDDELGLQGLAHDGTVVEAPDEPPYADPHVRWCGRGRGEPGPYPIMASIWPPRSRDPGIEVVIVGGGNSAMDNSGEGGGCRRDEEPSDRRARATVGGEEVDLVARGCPERPSGVEREVDLPIAGPRFGADEPDLGSGFWAAALAEPLWAAGMASKSAANSSVVQLAPVIPRGPALPAAELEAEEAADPAQGDRRACLSGGRPGTGARRPAPDSSWRSESRGRGVVKPSPQLMSGKSVLAEPSSRDTRTCVPLRFRATSVTRGRRWHGGSRGSRSAHTADTCG